MRHLVFSGPGDLAWQECPDPQLRGPRDALVRPLAVARCDLDPVIALGLYPITPPFAMGHEMVGEIVDLGDSVTHLTLGERVIVPFQASCGDCAPCRRGLSNACVTVPPGTAFGLGPHGGVDLGGALADLVRVPFADLLHEIGTGAIRDMFTLATALRAYHMAREGELPPELAKAMLSGV